jgi:hypothetical protein
MPKISIVCGILLALLGVICYVCWQELGADKASPTALIPAVFGALLVLFGALSLAKPAMRMHFMHVAVTVGLLGFLAALPMVIRGLIKKGLVVAPIAQLIMAIICGIFVALCVRSFINARRAREQQQPT